jgi:hypothetical protein
MQQSYVVTPECAELAMLPPLSGSEAKENSGIPRREQPTASACLQVRRVAQQHQQEVSRGDTSCTKYIANVVAEDEVD